MLDKAIALVAAHFEGRFDKGGQPYILHCLHVMNAACPNGDDHELMCIAVMHDLVEDTDIDLDDLFALGFSNRVVAGVDCMTHKKGEDYLDVYIHRIALNPDAKKVKIADLDHNSRLLRQPNLRAKDFRRLEKYHRAYEYLKD
jgi:(p)ppGpp synthase/HD superfamily hydrolase